jgi:hypothetical protein
MLPSYFRVVAFGRRATVRSHQHGQSASGSIAAQATWHRWRPPPPAPPSPRPAIQKRSSPETAKSVSGQAVFVTSTHAPCGANIGAKGANIHGRILSVFESLDDHVHRVVRIRHHVPGESDSGVFLLEPLFEREVAEIAARVPLRSSTSSYCTILCQRSASAVALSGSTTYRRILASTNGFNSGAANR